MTEDTDPYELVEKEFEKADEEITEAIDNPLRLKQIFVELIDRCKRITAAVPAEELGRQFNGGPFENMELYNAIFAEFMWSATNDGEDEEALERIQEAAEAAEDE